MSEFKAITTQEEFDSMVKERLDRQAKKTAEELNLPLKAVTIPAYLTHDDRVKKLMEQEDVTWYPVEIYVKAPWE